MIAYRFVDIVTSKGKLRGPSIIYTPFLNIVINVKYEVDDLKVEIVISFT